ncbi:hypothetical protein SCUP234_08741 [Seiridium cupressi]
MNRYRAPAPVEPQPAPKPEAKKLRRKLQKIGGQRGSVQFATSNPKATESRGFLSAFSSKKADPEKSARRTTAPEPLPIDLSDPKWAEYLRTSRYTAKEIEFLPQPHSQESLSPPADVIPEFAHLNVSSDAPRKSSETISTEGPSTPSTSSSAASASRRYAKTPVTRIGQLEEVAVRDRSLSQNASSVELIAESYRALLDSRNSFLEERYMTPFQSFDEVPSDLGSRFWDVRPSTPLAAVLEVPQSPKQDIMGSPTSSDGTLVGFEEDAIYFKPVSVLTDPPSAAPLRTRNGPRSAQSMASIVPDNPTVQIVFDLLTKELSAAASGNTMRPSTETSSLQIWIMIEAYEKLREKVENTGLDAEQAESVQTMLNMWLRTLHTIHDTMTGNDGQRSESDYGDS